MLASKATRHFIQNKRHSKRNYDNTNCSYSVFLDRFQEWSFGKCGL